MAKFREPPKEHRFSSTNQPAKRGRKKNIYSHLKSDYDLSKDDVHTLIKFFLTRTPKELYQDYKKMDKPEKFTKITDKPAAYYLLVRNFFNDFKYGKIDGFVQLLDRLFGRPKQEVGLTAAMLNVDTFDVELTEDQKREYEQALLEHAGINKPDDKNK
jgi:hypothetical protein